MALAPARLQDASSVTGLQAKKANPSPSIALSNGSINFFYLTPLPLGIMLEAFHTRAMGVRLFKYPIGGGEEVMGQNIIG